MKSALDADAITSAKSDAATNRRGANGSHIVVGVQRKKTFSPIGAENA
ncbi:MAG: hypothetical protein H8F28_06255 [Fibrella sp.]|nr:hypothetical protein [Armatimonadota bacterium]